jgi:urea transport system permease protein
LIGCILLCRAVLSSKLGQLLVALRDEADRVRFSGYDVSNFKTFAFCLGAAISALGGAMFVLNVGFMSPKLITIEPSIYMVIFCAVGGRMSLVGAVYGTLLVNYGRTYFSEQFPNLWFFLLGGVFILVTRFFPMGLAGIVEDYGSAALTKVRKIWKGGAERLAAAPVGGVAEAPVTRS